MKHKLELTMSNMLLNAAEEYETKGGAPNFEEFEVWLEEGYGITFNKNRDEDGVKSINIEDEKKYTMFLLKYS